MIRESKTEFALLGILTQSDMSGYDIKKFIESSLGFFWNESFGQIYPTLKKLESNKLISSKNLNVNSAKAKIVYKITKKGLEKLKLWLEGNTSKSILRNELLLKLFFARNMDAKVLKKQLLETEENFLDEIEVYQQIIISIERACKDHPDKLYWLFTLDYGISNAKMNLEWLQRVKKKLKF